ncbi:STAS domain-containing protein [Lacibacterium aquatile]|uniref:STAS domain-containing protein n=1 Tax=Lacibacterium aquatile TaxID=1168082 RepID=A0ABW5DLA2_9PROT
MSSENRLNLTAMVSDHEQDILTEWLKLLTADGMLQSGRLKEVELRTECRDLLTAFKGIFSSDPATKNNSDRTARDKLSEISRSRAIQGFSPTETATFVFSLKQALFEVLNKVTNGDVDTHDIWQISLIIDSLGLHTMQTYQHTREEVIVRQQQEIAELSTPVVKLWDGILALPLIGTLDSQRTQVVMENLLQSIVDESAEIAILDITGVPTVDTLTAQHLLKAIAAARLMGADCIISGIRPQIAQTMVHLGVELNVVSKATLADAFAVALQRTNKFVAVRKTQAAADRA